LPWMSIVAESVFGGAAGDAGGFGDGAGCAVSSANAAVPIITSAQVIIISFFIVVSVQPVERSPAEGCVPGLQFWF